MDHSLPAPLSERFRWLVHPDSTAHAPGEFVLYWMHNAIRAHENPALDVAICLARQNGLPLLVYRALSEDYPYASDRYHAFILQGQRDVQRELVQRGIPSHFHLERDGHRGAHLRDLTRRAAVLVTEEMPVQPLVGWMERLVNRTTTPIAMVDASCLVPMPLVKESYTRAFEYRQATKELYSERLDQPYEEQQVDCQVFSDPLPFRSLDLEDICLAKLIGQCNVDHSIAPVSDTPGGTRAGYQRWDQFKSNGLEQYEERRDDATDHGGVSRMSAYLHFGMVSPFRVAREASALGASKYLDELLVWREMSFHFCFHNIEVIDTLDAIPDWAKETLCAHSQDPRAKSYSWETLARGRSGQVLWDACQRSLIKQGELHNNLRMSWGKAFLGWAKTPARSLQLSLDLNHRYALDGRDPCSYGGVLWCFGQFDRPFEPEAEILGKVRPRPLDQHQQRLDLKRFAQIVDRPIAAEHPRIAVIGAGVGGLIAARTLADHGIETEVFEKSRDVGGRLATRDLGDATAFDHGAQYFTARDPRFCRYVQSWIQDGLIQPWMGRIVELTGDGQVVEEKLGTPRFVGTPGMKSIARHLAKDATIRTQTRVDRLELEGNGWQLFDESHNTLGHFDVVIANCPPAQTHAIFSGHTSLVDEVAKVQMRPCWALLIRTKAMETPAFAGAFVNEGPISWVACNSAKPGRGESEQSSWTVHASAEWTEQHLDDDAEDVQQVLLTAFEELVGKVTCEFATAHLWRYAIPDNPLTEDCLWDSANGLGACGDWCGGPRVEGAFLSGLAMSGSVLRHVTIDRKPALSS